MHFINRPTISLAKDLITVILTIVGLLIARSGLLTWKRQVKGVKEFEIAYNLNYSLLKLREAIKHVRNPFIWNAENSKALQHFKNKYSDSSNNEDLKRNSDTYVYEMRWEEITKSYTEMESHLLGAEVLWGPEILDKISPLKDKVIKLKISLMQYLEPETRAMSSEEIHDIIYDRSHGGEEDVFSKETGASIEEITKYIKQKIK